MRRTVVVMIKEPRAGRVKTRLGRDIGMTAAAWWYRHQVRRLLRHMTNPRWDVVLAVTPDRAGMRSRIWPQRFERWPQGTGDLDQRMARLLRHARGPICIIGSDIPCIRAPHIHAAFKAIDAQDVVFGPAPDGGFWLVGVRQGHRLPRRIFHNVRWSTHHALSDTLANLSDTKVGFTTTLSDVDDATDLVALNAMAEIANDLTLRS